MRLVVGSRSKKAQVPEVQLETRREQVMNNVTLVGNLTKAPELRYTQSGKPVTSFSVAVNKRKKVGDKWEDELEGFFNCTLWNGAEHFAENFDKGQRVIVVGRITQRSWENDNGDKRTAVELQVEEIGASIRFADSGNGNGRSPQSSASADDDF